MTLLGIVFANRLALCPETLALQCACKGHFAAGRAFHSVWGGVGREDRGSSARLWLTGGRMTLYCSEFNSI